MTRGYRLARQPLRLQFLVKLTCGLWLSSFIACGAHGHGTIRLHEVAMPSSIDSITAASFAGYIPESSQLMISNRASGGYPSSSLDCSETRRPWER